MNLGDVEKEILGFLFERIGNKPKGSFSMRHLQTRFAEVPKAQFTDICDELIGEGLIANFIGDQLSFTSEGWYIAHGLAGVPVGPVAVEEAPPVNEHLVWDLSKLADYRKASMFAKQFRKSLCVFSAPVQQLYSNYDILVPQDNDRKLTILPNPRADHDTFNFVTAESVIPTRLFIAPDDNGALLLMMPLSDGGWRKVPLGAGLNMVQSKLGEVPFLPVLTKGDLREQSPSNPVLHLHRILLHKLDQRSAMEVRGIRRVIQDNLAEHFGYIPVGSKSVAMGGTPTMQRSAIA
jgi:hypothetical protein